MLRIFLKWKRRRGIFFRFADANSDEYKLVILLVTKEELERAVEEKQRVFDKLFETLHCVHLRYNADAEELAEKYAAAGVLSDKHIDDLRHMAYAVVSGCRYVAAILSVGI